MNQPSLLSLPLNLDGATYDPARDGTRLGRQLQAVKAIMADGHWHTLPELCCQMQQQGIHASDAAVSARLRDLRKAKFGGHEIAREHVVDGIWRYRMVNA
jgi:hypothetical protein